MVKVTLDLTEHELEIFSHCIESAIDVKHMNEQEKKTAKIILEKLNKHLISPKVCGK